MLVRVDVLRRRLGLPPDASRATIATALRVPPAVEYERFEASFFPQLAGPRGPQRRVVARTGPRQAVVGPPTGRVDLTRLRGFPGRSDLFTPHDR